MENAPDADKVARIITCSFVTVWLHMALLPHGSIACQVRVIVSVLVIVLNTSMTRFVSGHPLSATGLSKLHWLVNSTSLSEAQVKTSPPKFVIVKVWPAALIKPTRNTGLGLGVTR